MLGDSPDTQTVKCYKLYSMIWADFVYLLLILTCIYHPTENICNIASNNHSFTANREH